MKFAMTMVSGKTRSHSGHKQWPYTQSVTSSSPAPPLTHAAPSGARPGWAETRPPAPLQRSSYFSAAQISTRSSDFENELKETRRSRLFNIQQE